MGRSWDYYDDIAHLYDSQYEEPYWKLYHIITERLIERSIDRYKMPATLDVLDLGSGTGIWMEYFVERGDRVTCLEPSKNMIEMMQIKAQALEKEVNIISGICEQLPMDHDTYDLVNAQGDVFSYALKPTEGLSEAYRVLKAGGLLIGSVDSLYAFLNDSISVGDFNAFKQLLKDKKSRIGNNEISRRMFDTTLFTPDDLQTLLKKVGFEEIEIAGKVVFGPYEEEVIIDQMDLIAEFEEQHAFTKELIGKAEHLHFSARKPLYK